MLEKGRLRLQARDEEKCLLEGCTDLHEVTWPIEPCPTLASTMVDRLLLRLPQKLGAGIGLHVLVPFPYSVLAANDCLCALHHHKARFSINESSCTFPSTQTRPANGNARRSRTQTVPHGWPSPSAPFVSNSRQRCVQSPA